MKKHGKITPSLVTRQTLFPSPPDIVRFADMLEHAMTTPEPLTDTEIAEIERRATIAQLDDARAFGEGGAG